MHGVYLYDMVGVYSFAQDAVYYYYYYFIIIIMIQSKIPCTALSTQPSRLQLI